MEREGCHILNCFLFEIRKLSVFGFVFYVYVNKLETNMAASIVYNNNLLFSPSMTTAAGSCRDRELAENISLGYGGSQLVLSP